MPGENNAPFAQIDGLGLGPDTEIAKQLLALLLSCQNPSAVLAVLINQNYLFQIQAAQQAQHAMQQWSLTGPPPAAYPFWQEPAPPPAYPFWQGSMPPVACPFLQGLPLASTYPFPMARGLFPVTQSANPTIPQDPTVPSTPTP